MNKWVEYFKNGQRTIFNHCLNKRQLIKLIIANTPEEGRILEAGCGTAMLSVILADSGFKVTALDLDEEVLDYAKNNIRLADKHLDFMAGDILKLSSLFEEKYFDVTCHSGVMEHFGDHDIVKGLSEQRIVSKKVIFSIPNNRNKLNKKFFGDERFLSNKKWIELIKQAGFKKIALFGEYHDFQRNFGLFLPGAFFRKKLSFWWKWFSHHSIFLCE